MEGARDLLEEVVAKADGALKAKAQAHARPGSAERWPHDRRRGRSPPAARPAHRARRRATDGARLPRLADAARRPHGAGRARARAVRSSPTRRSPRVCAGRTDAGVHATEPGRALRRAGRARRCRLGARRQPLPAARRSRCSGARPVAAGFHARFGAHGAPLPLLAARIDPVRPALRRRRVRLGASGRSTATRCAAAAALLVGEHDFSVVPRRRVPGRSRR
ncbi:MAG: hypothetical protein MZW92_73915 [Comamonadaceae bacterium]|nr:hypothetical protein [Comamonadaceae bacterium]